MKGLLYKDMILCWNRRNFFFLITALSIILAATSENPMFVSSYVTMVFGMFSISSISYDEYDNGNSFLFTLPFTRTGYVLEKYIFTLLISGIPWLISSIMVTCLQKYRAPELNAFEWFLTTFIFLYLIILFLSIMLPLQLKYGSEKSRLFLAGFFGVVFVACILLSKLTSFSAERITRLLQSLSEFTPLQLVLSGAVISVILFFISGLCSLKIMNAKEF